MAILYGRGRVFSCLLQIQLMIQQIACGKKENDIQEKGKQERLYHQIPYDGSYSGKIRGERKLVKQLAVKHQEYRLNHLVYDIDTKVKDKGADDAVSGKKLSGADTKVNGDLASDSTSQRESDQIEEQLPIGKAYCMQLS